MCKATQHTMMKKVLISLPEELATRMRAAIPNRKRSKAIAQVIEQEVEQREQQLAQCAQEIEKDQHILQEMKEWEVTLADGLTDEAG